MTYLPIKYKITGIKCLADDIKLFYVKSNLNPMPGQFIEVSLPGIGEIPLASCTFDKNNINLLVRNVGIVTSKLFSLKNKDSIFIRGPYGKGWPLNELKEKDLFIIAGGTGIAPVTSLIEYIEKNKKDFRKISIYFGFRSKEYILLKEKINSWKKKFKLIISLDEKAKGYETGHLPNIIEKTRLNAENSVALMCGPEIMMSSSTKALNKIGLANNKIFWSLERRMECAIGNCGRCLIQDVYVCKDGPVFRYDKIKPKLENEQSN
ncbi:MAG: FAD/NAD(P)-binding protein [archaeon]